MHLHWHRRDLRLVDNRGLAAGVGPTQGVFVFDPAVLANASAPRVSFLLESLSELRAGYRERGSDLLLVRGHPRKVLPALVSALDATSVTWCRDYSGLARSRDAAVGRALDAGVEHRAVDDAVFHPPGEITTAEGEPYRVFTYYSRKWHERSKPDPVNPPTGDDFVCAGSVTLDGDAGDLLEELPTAGELGFGEPEAEIPDGGSTAALERLEAFCEGSIHRYADCRDYPATDCTSRLSPHLKFGTVGIRQVYAATERAARDAAGDDGRESVREFQDQLAWREFYAQVLWDRPDVVGANYRTYENPIEWRTDPEGLQAWKDGRTGYPVVDAGMRQLRAEGYVHNRVRMVVASFLTKDLLVDWREGYDWFREKLVDHDTANDAGGWQWAASTGTDAQPYFRIFNPMTQGERYDPDAEYIQRYVEELEGVPPDVVHSWDELDDDTRRTHAPDYPAPVVDHAERREEALAMFERARGKGD